MVKINYFDFEPVADLPASERGILFDTLHFNRGDIIIESSETAITLVNYKLR
ncbi:MULTISPECIES: hypothetical protein [unclassified Aerococcus]|uniref:hypothetical protein n=1 Tax=unclassified Aerococcus TaxID=2618060 RepID=UPI0025C67867|nr:MULTISPECIES: hypothetical protein [unclassified Aerococcus]